jgi:hypothetical protein
LIVKWRWSIGASQDTFVGRMEGALDARDREELAELFTGLPAAPQLAGGTGWAPPWPRSKEP